MLFSLFGEIALTIIGLLYVGNCWFDSFINLMVQMKNNDDIKLSDAAKRMYS